MSATAATVKKAKEIEIVVADMNLTAEERLAIAVAYRHRALLMSGRGNGIKEVDVYMAKYKAYDAEAKSWETRITPALLLGKSQAAAISPSFSIWRS